MVVFREVGKREVRSLLLKVNMQVCIHVFMHSSKILLRVTGALGSITSVPDSETNKK